MVRGQTIERVEPAENYERQTLTTHLTLTLNHKQINRQ